MSNDKLNLDEIRARYTRDDYSAHADAAIASTARTDVPALCDKVAKMSEQKQQYPVVCGWCGNVTPHDSKLNGACPRFMERVRILEHQLDKFQEAESKEGELPEIPPMPAKLLVYEPTIPPTSKYVLLTHVQENNQQWRARVSALRETIRALEQRRDEARQRAEEAEAENERLRRILWNIADGADERRHRYSIARQDSASAHFAELKRIAQTALNAQPVKPQEPTCRECGNALWVCDLAAYPPLGSSTKRAGKRGCLSERCTANRRPCECAEKCPRCEGSGKFGGGTLAVRASTVCTNCYGTGLVKKQAREAG